MWPGPRADSSRTRYLVEASARSTVSGWPNSLLNDPAGAIVGPRRSISWAARSLVVVLPDEPDDARDRDGGQRDRPGSEHRGRAGRHGSGGEVVPVGPLPRDRGEQAARPGPPGVDHHLAGYDRRRVAVQPAAGDLGDPGQGQRDHMPTPHG